MRSLAGREELERAPSSRTLPIGGVAGWLFACARSGLRGWLRRTPRPRPRLALLERIALAPRQSLALVEAEGRRLLVVTSADGGSAFFPLDDGRSSQRRADESATFPRKSSRVSW
jgi:hypothetical protein